jgi:hypothetical protein
VVPCIPVSATMIVRHGIGAQVGRLRRRDGKGGKILTTQTWQPKTLLDSAEVSAVNSSWKLVSLRH